MVPARRRTYLGPMPINRLLIVIGLAVVVIGLLWPWLSKLGLGRLPGDIVVRRDAFSFYFPIVTCLVISVVASLLFWLFRR
jgi:formate hydrogenlyase subunit 3/multisubunit Na+/H+ antiporter MnhD subunit